MRHWKLFLLSMLLITTGSTCNAVPRPAANPTPTVYLPTVQVPGVAVTNPPATPRINAPYLNVSDLSVSDNFAQAGIFWFGQVDRTNNYTDVRVSYNDTELYIYSATFDRLLWYDTTPTVNDLLNWDSVSVYLGTSGGSSKPNSTTYRFDAAFSETGGAQWQAAYQGNGSGWQATPITFTTKPGWRGDKLNDTLDDKGWAMHFHIPFASLGMPSRPADGSTWWIGVRVNDRDDAAGTAIAPQSWPPSMATDKPDSWGAIAFGLSTYTAPATTNNARLMLRHKLNGIITTDAAVGGGTDCGVGIDFWTQLGNKNWQGETVANVQNQSDIADWNCYSKFYLTIPLNTIPAGKAIVSATLTLHQMGGSGATNVPASPAVVQIFRIDSDWNESTITWNNAPLAAENLTRTTIESVVGCGAPQGIAWPCIPRNWDLSLAVAKAYAAGQPLRIALYSADSNYHTGKYFTTADTGDWNETGRPTLTVTYGTP